MRSLNSRWNPALIMGQENDREQLANVNNVYEILKRILWILTSYCNSCPQWWLVEIHNSKIFMFKELIFQCFSGDGLQKKWLNIKLSYLLFNHLFFVLFLPLSPLHPPSPLLFFFSSPSPSFLLLFETRSERKNISSGPPRWSSQHKGDLFFSERQRAGNKRHQEMEDEGEGEETRERGQWYLFQRYKRLGDRHGT